ncbi:hypothetical protein SFC27_05565 [Bacillus licheniformis]|uniref:hypothetical protein n=1 Tax=Bacillus TaxID=1386 RepID=UPI00038E468B|nr:MULTISPECIES: hypothetical protein [Bacillus]MBY8348033.1 hypothetical protein [Bacillus sp. PCH94]MDP4080038.1 hypothetical protein [Bacillota bacterium]ARC60456.1 hypothetical protein BaDB11_01814 [Bacillus licheniformis]ARC63861.1 hypothetical protein B14_00836 [Bacillus licheniformis]ASV16953.1 hypothetical protein CJO35_18060 [Bacillus sp. 1s-1]
MDKIQDTVNDMKIISQALQTLKLESLSLNSPISERFDITFIGENFNVINSYELRNVLEHHFNLNIPHEALLVVIPHVCKANNMKFEGFQDLKDSINQEKTVSMYQITLT